MRTILQLGLKNLSIFNGTHHFRKYCVGSSTSNPICKKINVFETFTNSTDKSEIEVTIQRFGVVSDDSKLDHSQVKAELLKFVQPLGFYLFVEKSIGFKNFEGISPGHLSSYISFGEECTEMKEDYLISFCRKTQLINPRTGAKKVENIENLYILTHMTQMISDVSSASNPKLLKPQLRPVNFGTFDTVDQMIEKCRLLISQGVPSKPKDGLYVIKVDLSHLKKECFQEIFESNIKQVKKDRVSAYKGLNGILFYVETGDKEQREVRTLYQTRAYNCITAVTNHLGLKEDFSEISKDASKPDQMIRRNPSVQTGAFSLLSYILGCQNTNVKNANANNIAKLNGLKEKSAEKLNKLFEKSGLIYSKDCVRHFELPLAEICSKVTTIPFFTDLV